MQDNAKFSKRSTLVVVDCSLFYSLIPQCSRQSLAMNSRAYKWQLRQRRYSAVANITIRMWTVAIKTSLLAAATGLPVVISESDHFYEAAFGFGVNNICCCCVRLWQITRKSPAGNEIQPKGQANGGKLAGDRCTSAAASCLLLFVSFSFCFVGLLCVAALLVLEVSTGILDGGCNCSSRSDTAAQHQKVNVETPCGLRAARVNNR